MTSNYDRYIRPETWPIPTEAVGYLFEGRNLPGGLVEVRCVGELGSEHAGRIYTLDKVPREHVRGVIDAVVVYRTACSKLIGQP